METKKVEKPMWYNFAGAIIGVIFLPIFIIYWLGTFIMLANAYVNGIWDEF